MLMNINNNVKVILLLFYSKKKKRSKNANRYGNRYSYIPTFVDNFAVRIHRNPISVNISF